ncbi:hypothetical protein ABT297_17950 [Dactylosporangium sp. NPDC000555]|uniref:hypothetical protein n=1 Tax=Dactylosporangium sp. NPDC000555 TaxID=3154260 RepID=UPI00331ED11E
MNHGTRTLAPAGVREQTRRYLEEHIDQLFRDDEDIVAAGLIDSMFMVQLVGFAEGEFGIEVDTGELNLTHFCSVDAITAFVLGKATTLTED